MSGDRTRTCAGAGPERVRPEGASEHPNRSEWLDDTAHAILLILSAWLEASTYYRGRDLPPMAIQLHYPLFPSAAGCRWPGVIRLRIPCRVGTRRS